MKSYEDTFFIDRELFNFLFLYLIIAVIYQLNAFQAITIHDSRSNKYYVTHKIVYSLIIFKFFYTLLWILIR